MKRKKQKRNEQLLYYFARTARSGYSDLIARIPELAPLATKSITVIGLGSLGAPSVLEFARCGIGELRILDFDIIEAGTTVRWPFGLSSVGKKKTDVLEKFIKENYPYTNVFPYSRRIGEVRQSIEIPSELEDLEMVLGNTDLIFDASAELGLQHMLSDMANEYHIPYIGVSTTYGTWGGILVRIRPEKTEGCWRCYMKNLEDGTFPTPHSDPVGEVQPEGCSSPTFTGTSFDAGTIALSGVRLAVSTLTENDENGYPGFEWDVAVINLRDETGQAIPPLWDTHTLNKNPLCTCTTNP